MGKIKTNEEGRHPPAQFLAAVTLLLMLTATQKWALLWGTIGQQIFAEAGPAFHVAQAHRTLQPSSLRGPGEGLGRGSGVGGGRTTALVTRRGGPRTSLGVENPGGGDPTFSALGPCCCCSPCTGTRVRLGPGIAQRVSHPSWRAKVSTKEPMRHLRDRRPGLPWPSRAAESLAGCSRDPGLRRGGSWGCGEDRARPAGLQPASQASPLLALL